MILRLACLVARRAGWLSRRLGRGGGTTVPGVVLLRLRPNAVAELGAQLKHGAILVSATNGKTTTTRLIVAAAEALGLRVVTNAEGSNLERGVATALLLGTGDGPADLAVLEVDEAALPAVTRALQPRALVLMNLFRDQLDRYGELDTLVDLWRDLLDDPTAVTESCTLVLNADDPNLADLGRSRSNVVWFGIDDASHALTERAHAADATRCRQCGHAISHDVVLLGHLGHWHCTNGDAQRPAPTVRATAIALAADGQAITVAIDDSPLTMRSGLAGLHNSYNLTSAVAATYALPGIHGHRAEAARAIAATPPAFGRGETVVVNGRTLNLLLAKNPTGVNQNIRTVLSGAEPVHVLALLNDRTADGKDVSWIWDVDWEPLNDRLASLTLSGERAWDLALRFRYGGFDMDKLAVEPEVPAALDRAIAATPAGETLHALPTYTAMLDLRAELTRRGLVDEYWSEP